MIIQCNPSSQCWARWLNSREVETEFPNRVTYVFNCFTGVHRFMCFHAFSSEYCQYYIYIYLYCDFDISPFKFGAYLDVHAISKHSHILMLGRNDTLQTEQRGGNCQLWPGWFANRGSSWFWVLKDKVHEFQHIQDSRHLVYIYIYIYFNIPSGYLT